ncbi:lysylphosphatidylglycerol synthase transmembrane domain-containing protein [Actinoplanes sp. RD1]|uniref:lysylphosphatidylglycerol synthase transmembrane domain-containing protein n=1 Tax=Actinoplanes sp. RD1 TaxID=3064538 RepID=UPI0027424E5A|nr:YbhN family protein [Actinoplanes sp. RD1]
MTQQAVRHRRPWIRRAGVTAVLVVLAVELVVGWPALSGALRQVRMPHLGWLSLVVLAELAAMSAYARMQRRLLRSAGVRSSYRDNASIVYAAHSLNETLPGGPALSTLFNFQQLRRLGAGPAGASWVIALSGLLSTIALAAVAAGGAIAVGGAPDWTRLAAMLTLAALLVVGVRHLTRHPAAAEALLRHPLAAVNRLLRRPPDAGRGRVTDFVSQLRTVRLRPVDGLAAALAAVLNWLLDAAALWLSFAAVDARPPSVTVALLAFCAAMAAGSVTIVPGGFGIVDSALLLGLTMGGTQLPAAVAAVLLYRIVSFGLVIGLGWVSWLRLRLCPGLPAAGPARTAASARGGPRTSLRRLAVCPQPMTPPDYGTTVNRERFAG